MNKLPKDPYQLLHLYPTIQQMILDRTLEILTPYQEIDNNIGGGSAGFISNPTEQSVMALCDDELLEELRRVESALNEVSFGWDRWTKEYGIHFISLGEFLDSFEFYLRKYS